MEEQTCELCWKRTDREQWPVTSYSFFFAVIDIRLSTCILDTPSQESTSWGATLRGSPKFEGPSAKLRVSHKLGLCL
jgi:hypothetical protein